MLKIYIANIKMAGRLLHSAVGKILKSNLPLLILPAVILLTACSPTTAKTAEESPVKADEAAVGAGENAGTGNTSKKPPGPDMAAEGGTIGPLSIVVTIFPIYDWTVQILGDCGQTNMEVRLLIDNGTDMHSYQPTVDDMIDISDCDILIYTGGESDEWIDDAAAVASNQDHVILNLMDALGDKTKAEETVEGMQEERERKSIFGTTGSVNNEEEYDEHIWLSLRNAAMLSTVICDVICDADPVNADYYRKNLSAYLSTLDALDISYRDAVSEAEFDTLLFADRFPFRYLVDDYGLNYYAAFSGCSAESEASFETIIFLAEKLDELKLPAVLTMEYSETRLADTIISCTKDPGRRVLELNSMQSVRASDITGGISYTGTMEKNLEVLKAALNR